jgi:hybrid cluster-associated redox disulfide protein
MPKITKAMSFGEVISRHPETAMIMMNHGLHCVGCHAAAYETIEQGAKAHGMTEKDMEKMIREMNEAIAKK